MIDIRKFVDVNVIHHSVSTAASTRDTTVMFVDNSDYANIDSIVNSLAGALTLLSLSASDAVPEVYYLKAYFANGGQKLHIKSVTLTGSAEAESIVTAIRELPDEEIVVAFPAQIAYLASAIAMLNADTGFYGIKIKFAVLGVDYNEDAYVNTPHLITAILNGSQDESAMIAAYLSKINISSQNSIKDYDFTVVSGTADALTDAELDITMENNVNCLLKLAGQVRVVGGNTCDSRDLVNEFTLIVLQQTVTEKVLSIITQKLKGEQGCAAINVAIAQELDRYVTNGYLATDKIWKDEDYTITYGNPAQTFVIISKNTALLSGYQVKVLPYSSLTADDKAAHKAPPIYLVLADSYGIRKVTINGEVF